MSAGPATPDGLTVARLRWRCRRGMRELDELLLRFLEHDFAGASADEQRAFARLLELADPDLLDLLLARVQAPDPVLAGLVARLRHGAAGGHA